MAQSPQDLAAIEAVLCLLPEPDEDLAARIVAAIRQSDVLMAQPWEPEEPAE